MNSKICCWRVVSFGSAITVLSVGRTCVRNSRGPVGRQQLSVHEKSRRSGFLRQCAREDSNLHPAIAGPGPQPGASTSSATGARNGESSRRLRRRSNRRSGLAAGLLAALLRGGVPGARVRVGDLRGALLRHALLAQALVLLVVLHRRTVIFCHASSVPDALTTSTLDVAGQTVAGAGRNPRSRKV